MAAIKKQVEFYFSDSNYRKDTFLRAAAESDAEGFVPISVLLTFNKLKSLTTDCQAVADAVKDSNFVVLSSDEKKIKRTEPLPDVDTSAERTLYVKGFPLNDDSVTVESIGEQFSAFGKVLYVRLRRDNEKKFKGSCFVEYSTDAEMQAANDAANADEKMNLSYNGTPYLCVIPFKTWHSNKQAKFNKKKTDKQVTEESGKRKLDQVAQDPVFDHGLLVKLTNVPTTTTAISLKEFLKTHVDVKFVEYTSGESTAVVRLADGEIAKNLAASKLAFKVGETEHNLEGAVISGEEETAFWAKKGQDDRNKPKGGNRNNNKGRGNFKKQRR